MSGFFGARRLPETRVTILKTSYRTLSVHAVAYDGQVFTAINREGHT